MIQWWKGRVSHCNRESLFKSSNERRRLLPKSPVMLGTLDEAAAKEKRGEEGITYDICKEEKEDPKEKKEEKRRQVDLQRVRFSGDSRRGV